MPIPAILRRRVIAPIQAVLAMGVTPKRIAVSVAAGSIIGIFPFLGTTTVLSTVVAFRFRLNLVVMQAFNWLVAGIQLLLLLPFMRLGEKLFRTDPIPLTREQVVEMFSEGFFHSIRTLGSSLIHAMSGWAVIAPLIFAGLYFAALPLAQKLAARQQLIAKATIDGPLA
jgi:uncharacterized protein (DUF2062 family)